MAAHPGEVYVDLDIINAPAVGLFWWYPCVLVAIALRAVVRSVHGSETYGKTAAEQGRSAIE